MLQANDDVFFPGCIAASQGNDVYTSGISNGEVITMVMSRLPQPPGGAKHLTLSYCLSCPACGEGAELLRSSSGVITSPGWPFQYPARLNCTWNIRAQPGDAITIRLFHYHRTARGDEPLPVVCTTEAPSCPLVVFRTLTCRVPTAAPQTGSPSAATGAWMVCGSVAPLCHPPTCPPRTTFGSTSTLMTV